MCNSKEYITRLKNEPKSLGVALIYEEAKKDVRFYNSAIKSLKKQLPAPMKEEIFYNIKIVNCPICDSALDTWAENYCWKCGQKLR